MKCYRFVTEDLKSKNGDVQWTVGEWVKHSGELDLCHSGLHACKEPRDSLDYAYGVRWFQAEARGKILESDDKFCASEMRLVKEIPLKVIQRFAVDCAEHVLHIYEKQYPDDNRVRVCINATKDFIENPTEENHQKMAAAWAAETTTWAARYAAWAARYAARATARDAAWDAAWTAAWAARDAAWDAAGAAARDAEEKWQKNHLKQLIKEALL